MQFCQAEFYPACYRVAPDAEIILTKFNVLTKDIFNIPEGLYYAEFNSDLGVPSKDVEIKRKHIDQIALITNAILCDEHAMVAISMYDHTYVFNNKVERYQFADNVRYMHKPGVGIQMNNNWAIPIGIKCHHIYTYRSCDMIPKIYVDNRINKIWSNDGLLDINFDLNRVDKEIDKYNYLGYNQALYRDAYGIIYYNHKPRICYSRNGELVLGEEVIL